MYHCKVCGHRINLGEDGVGYCPICDKKVSYGDVVPERCIDPYKNNEERSNQEGKGAKRTLMVKSYGKYYLRRIYK